MTEMTPATLTPNGTPEPSRGTDFARLRVIVERAGLLEPRHRYHAVKISVTVALVVAGWVTLVAAGPSWWQLVTAAFLGVMFTQVGFLAHDAGHKQIFRSRRGSHLLGALLGNLGIGLGYGWWIDKHNRHHAHPNDTERDPDVGSGALVFDPAAARTRHGLGLLVVRCQAYLFFPMLLLEAVNLHIASLRALRRQRGADRLLEGGLLLAHLAIYLGLVFVALPPGKAIAFIAVQQGIFGLYLGCSFAPNHKGMPLLTRADRLDYLRRQVLTSRNIRGSVFVDYALGGLNYQIEHHLFPGMPRPNLRRAQPLVIAFCQQIGVSYLETGLIQSYRQSLSHLNRVAGPPTAG